MLIGRLYFYHYISIFIIIEIINNIYFSIIEFVNVLFFIMFVYIIYFFTIIDIISVITPVRTMVPPGLNP